MSFRMKLVIAYLGGPFNGWQRQRNQPTVQGEVEGALAALLSGRHIAIHGAGRTDSGVHAAAQVAHCDLPVEIPSAGLVRGLNRLLPETVHIRSASRVGPGFHARRSAVGKLYTYRARWHERTLPWLDPRAALAPQISDLSELAKAALELRGTHDWASFSVPDLAVKTTVRTVYRVRLRRHRNGIDFDFVGNGFLRYQVRRMVGALLEVGRARRTIDDLRSLIENPRPGASITTAPPSGLSLERVYYRRYPFLSLDP